MSTTVQETQLTMDMILKMTPEVFRDIMKVQTLGYKKSLINLLKAQYEQCSMVKESLVAVLNRVDTIPDDEKIQCETALKDLYMCMQLIEDRHTILDLLVKEEEAKVLLRH